ncbi:hypothetical protein LYNGBM3L_09730 [Moorena producens 3L]|uniref:Uncharacterized protein n=1 Tax=Moorena producens 3L TaxID=489825 RepID=F4XK78_9CYAN|nr:hypothetical protein LYNGBM3L_09730 [Moorena producens 3L]OLT64710.1 hypothetical protein BI334_06380 [Moorena producens 3L]
MLPPGSGGLRCFCYLIQQNFIKLRKSYAYRLHQSVKVTREIIERKENHDTIKAVVKAYQEQEKT